MKEFKIGDRVKVKNDIWYKPSIEDETGTVIKIDGSSVGVEFDNYVDGHSLGGEGKYGHCWLCFPNMLKHIKGENKIVICRNGNEVVAVDKMTGKKGVAKCNPEDKFDFITGAKLALDRLIVREVKRPAKVGEYIKIVNPVWTGKRYHKGDIFKVCEHFDNGPSFTACVKVYDIDIRILDKEYVVLEGYAPVECCKPVEEVKPHLTLDNSYFGEIGKKTNFKDVIGRPLYIGDTVELYDDCNEFYGEKCIVEINRNTGVMGIMGACSNNGKIIHDWKIIKKRNYYDIADGEVVDCVKYVGKCNA